MRAQEISQELRPLWEQRKSYFPENQEKANLLRLD